MAWKSQPTATLLRSVAGRYSQNCGAPARRGAARRVAPDSAIAHRGQTARGAPSAPAGPLMRDAELARVEAVLFLAREPLTSRKLANLARLADGTAARTLVRRLNRVYDLADTPFRVEEVAGGFILLTRAKFAAWLRRRFHSPIQLRLSAPAAETLAVIAYRQPVMRAEIEAIRGVQCDDILRHLMDRELVRIAGRATELGRPLLYGTTKRFLQVFGLRNLDDLPQAENLRRAEPPPEAAAAAPEEENVS
ncbi:MAG TPA: SMC-Scp complex subunit ScpB [Pirellulales bacterium]|jgi:segregation and condensation protein B|nr:SMC-Scp complex subunit ScpB [Pirellulales bacterium]